MITAGIMEKIGSELKLPKPVDRTKLQHATHHTTKMSVDTGLNIGINKKKSGRAIRDGMINAGLNTIFAPSLAKVDFLSDSGDLNTTSQARVCNKFVV